MLTLTFHACDPNPHSSFEEQWGSQLGLTQEQQADEDYESDQIESERLGFCELLFDENTEFDFEHESDLNRWTETCEPEIVG